MKKRLSALVLALVLTVCVIPAQALTGEGHRAAETLASLGIVQGDYNVDAPATRNQAAMILVRLAGAEAAAFSARAQCPFNDLEAWAAPAVRYAYAQGWLTGTTGNTFSGEEPITANDYCSYLMRTLGYTVGQDFAYDGGMAFARHMAVVNQNFEGVLSRGDLFEITAGALRVCYKGSEETVAGRLVSAGLASAAAVDALHLSGGELTARQIADRYTAAAFQLDLYNSKKDFANNVPTSNASGFFISADGIAITNYHSIDGAVAATATLAGGEVYEVAEVLYFDAGIDIAVIRVSTTARNGITCPGFIYLETASHKTLRAGDTVYTLGNPLGLGLAISEGIVSSTSQEVDRYDLPCIMSTADISQGSSGGALLNVYGQVTAITSGAFLFGNSMYLAVPIDPALEAELPSEGLTLEQTTSRHAKTYAEAVARG